MAEAELVMCLEMRGLWRIHLMSFIMRLCRSRRLAKLLLRSGLFDPRWRVNAGGWERIRLAEEFEVSC